MAPTSRIGFHASSTVENPGVEVSSTRNAMVGAYLFEIGIKEPATILAAKSPEVEEADLGDNGVRYRVVVGPRGSHQLTLTRRLRGT